jgi:hypothetical protein
MMSTSPRWIALDFVNGSGRTIHSTRSTFAILPPEVPSGGSERGA